jgi:hypothetical protein
VSLAGIATGLEMRAHAKDAVGAAALRRTFFGPERRDRRLEIVQ